MKGRIFIFLLCGLLIFSVFPVKAQEEDVEALPPEPAEEEVPAFEVEEEDVEVLPAGEEVPPFEVEEGTKAVPSAPVVPSEVPAEKPAVEKAKVEVEQPAPARRVLPEEAVPEGMELVLKAYEVRRGDCLWNIADDNYRDPFLWREIWDYNSYIKDPHWIFPGDDLIIPTYQKVELAEKTGQGPEVKLEKLEPGAEFEKDIFIAPPDFKFDGCIAGVKEKKSMTAYGDLVFIDLGKKQNVTPKAKYVIYREGDEVIHPATGEPMGIIVEKIGVLEVTPDVEEDSSTAQIIDSRKPIEVGDPIKLKGR